MNPFKEMVKPLTWGSHGSSLSDLCAKLPVKPLPAARSLTATPFGASRGTGFWPGPAVQAALTVGPADDEYEREADRVADQVMRMPEPGAQRSCRSCHEEETVQRAPLAARITPLVERRAAPEEEEELQTKPLAGQVQRAETKGGPAGLELEQSLAQARGSGSPLGEGVRGRMENAFGFDFSSVRIHSDARADSLSRSIQARAFTRGQDIFLRQGEYQPASARGQRLLAHELTHVVQQNGGAVQQAQMQAKGRVLQASEEAPLNKTGMPDHLKSGLESLSGMDLSWVRVHYSSSKPTQLNAPAYTRGQEIHVAPGQEKHLPHEGWHAVQQMQGRANPTMQMKDGVPVNDDVGLERESDVMGARGISQGGLSPEAAVSHLAKTSGNAAVQRVGEEKKDFNLKNSADFAGYSDGVDLFKAALVDMKLLRKQRKIEIFRSIPKKGVTEHYGGKLRNLNSMELLAQTKQFKPPMPHLLIENDEVLYKAANKPDEAAAPALIPIATITPKAFQMLGERPAEANRDVYTGGDKQYVKDVRNVPTRRYAYVEKNYWQFMEFLARNKLEGRYQNFFRAANLGVARPSVRGTRRSESKLVRGENDTKPLTNEQLAMLHQWKGSGLQQRGLSLTSTPRKNETVGNAGDNFRTPVGVRLMIDLARIPIGDDSPIMINHYAHSGVKNDVPSKVSKAYNYLESVIKNRELFLEFVKPEWIVNIEYHTKQSETNFPMANGNSADMMEAARRGTGYDKFAAGFAAKINNEALSETDKDDSDYKKGVEFADEYVKGYEAGMKEDQVKKVGEVPINPLEEIKDFDPKKKKDVYAIGRIHGRVRRAKPIDLAGIWS